MSATSILYAIATIGDSGHNTAEDVKSSIKKATELHLIEGGGVALHLTEKGKKWHARLLATLDELIHEG